MNKADLILSTSDPGQGTVPGRDPELALAVASRICHDLVSPVGAVVNGVDLLREMGASGLDETVAMIGQSAGRASALLQFYRIAFGAAAGDAQPVGRAALRELVSVLAQPPRVMLEWSGDGPPLGRPEARLVGLMLLCARSVTGLRGVISVSAGGAGAFPLAISVEADSFSGTMPMLEILEAGAASAPTPRSVEFVLAREAANELGAVLRVLREPGRVMLLGEAASGQSGSPPQER